MDVDRAISAVESRLGVADIVVNNAGWTHPNKPMLDVDEETFDIIYILTRGGPGTATQNLAYYTDDMGFGRFEFGLAGTLSIVQLVLLTGGTMALLGFAKGRERVPEGRALPPTVRATPTMGHLQGANS